MRVLLSIHPKYAELIFAGKKKFEYRKQGFGLRDISTIVLYATTPVKKVIGEFAIGCILVGTPTEIWMATKKESGVSLKEFLEYFAACKNAYAIQATFPIRYRNPLSLSEFCGRKTPPQSFFYI